ncbi:MAG: ADP-ribosylglycohydrolase family protein [Eubacteriales bacterium]|nr:ADP-ribosylglycohydrolase family protein [Eubacteriales bacterium]MDD4475475.1 ADP-ribosylglycohydrolase family protein [Eubacteriales bacterium]
MKTKILCFIVVLLLILSSCTQTIDGSSTDGTSSSTNETSNSTITFTLSEDEIYDKILGSWVGQAAGVVWGATTEFQYQRAMIPDDKVPVIESLNLNDVSYQDDLYVELPFIDAMKEYGVNCSLKQLADKFRDSEFGLDHANKIGRQNLRNGIEAPMSGHYTNNFHSDDIDWQIEADFLGHLYPGMVSEAAERAFEIGHIMNYGDGVYGGVFVTAMHAAAFTADSYKDIIDAGIASIPEDTQFRLLINDIVKWHSEGMIWQECWQKLDEKWDPTKRCLWYANGTANIDAKMNSGYILIGLLYGEGDFNKSMQISMQCGQDSDCNPSSVGAILGNFYGFEKLPEVWKSKIDLTGFKFSFTEHTMKSAVDLNFELALELLESKGFNNTDGNWEITTSEEIVPVEYEQWPPMPTAEIGYNVKDNVLILSVNAHDITGIKSVECDFGDGSSTSSGNTMHMYDEVGDYTIKCIITNNDDQSTEVTQEIKIEKIGSYTSPNRGQVRNVAEAGVPICSDLVPTGSGSKDLEVIRDGKKTGGNTDQFDTYVGYMSAHDEFVGYVFYEDFKISSVIFTEGMHFNNGGWFANGSLKLQAFKGGQWIDIETTVSPEYPNGTNMSSFGSNFTSYTFTFDEIECEGIRIFGTAGGDAGFISIIELEVTGVEAK